MLLLRFSALAALAAAAVGSEAADKVSVAFVGESGCPFCKAFVAGPLSSTYAADGVADIMDFDYIVFGNAYFVTPECGGAGSYDTNARQCFNRKCGRDAVQRPADCFSGDLICQHGPSECVGNRFLNCAEQTSGDKFLPYVFCFEAQMNATRTADWVQDLAASCAKSVGVDYDAILRCYGGEQGSDLVLKAAKATPWHPSVPYVLVNGQQLEDTDQLLQAVCGAYVGPKPAGCRGRGLKPLKEVLAFV